MKQAVILLRVKEAASASIQKIDSLTIELRQLESVSRVLLEHSNANVKSYGLSNMSTLSLRGSSSAQTKVLWHGFNINNSALGISDVSTMPLSFFDKISIAYGSDQAIGGALLLDNKLLDFKPAAQYKAAILCNSFNNINVGLGATFSDTLWQIQTRAAAKWEQNQYAFYNPNTAIRERIQHNAQRYVGFENSIYRKTSKGLLAWHCWWQNNDRQIPPSIFELVSTKQEKAMSFRNAFTYDVKNKAHLGLAVLFDAIQYSDSMQFIYTNAKVMSIPVQMKYLIVQQRNHKLDLEVASNFSSQVGAKNRHNLKTASVQANYVYNWKQKLLLSASGKNEWSDVFEIPWQARLHASYLIRNNSFYAGVAAQNRLPTLNELYYFPGGNPYLKPEYARAIEAGAHTHLGLAKCVQLKHHIATYARLVDNWILWNGSTIFSPSNIAQVYSRGLEDQLNIQYVINSNWQLNTDILYAYTLSTTHKSKIDHDNAIGKQIPYTPRYQFKSTARISVKQMALVYHYRYTGYRFITNDESYYLNPFSLHSLEFLYKYKHWRGALRCENLLDVYYEGVSGRIMPGRNYQLVLSCSL